MRFRAKATINRRREMAKFMQIYTTKDMTGLQHTILRIYSAYPKRSIWTLNEMQKELKSNGFYGRLDPSRAKLMFEMNEILRKFEGMFERRVMLGSAYFKRIGCRGVLGRAIAEKKFPQ